MNDNEGALADIIIAQLVTILLLALILWRIWQLVLPLALEGSSTLGCYPNAAAGWGFFHVLFYAQIHRCYQERTGGRRVEARIKPPTSKATSGLASNVQVADRSNISWSRTYSYGDGHICGYGHICG